MAASNGHILEKHVSESLLIVMAFFVPNRIATEMVMLIVAITPTFLSLVDTDASAICLDICRSALMSATKVNREILRNSWPLLQQKTNQIGFA